MRTKQVPSKTPRTRPDRTCRSSGTPSSWVSFKDAARLLGDDPYFWTDDSLHAVLRHYNVHHQPNAAKTILVHELCLLLGELREDAEKLSTKHRSCILRVAEVGPRRPFVHLLIEVLRYHINSENHDGDTKDYPYIATLTRSGRADDAASSTIQMTQAIREDYQRAYHLHNGGKVLDLEDEQAFARFLNDGPNPHVTYTREAVDLWASRLLQSLKSAGCGEQQMEMDDDQTASSQSINQDLSMSEDSGTTHDKSSENRQFHDCSNSVTSVSDEADSDYNPEKESMPLLNRVSRIRKADADEKIEETSEPSELDNEMDGMAQSADYDTDTDSVIARTTGRYGTIGRGQCPSCAKLHTIVREQHHAPTICK